VTFVGEKAIDAGGPARELITDTATSIFEKRAQIMTQTPNGVFVPSGAVDKKIYWAVGFFVAIVVRTSLVQELPFAPFVWKHIAGEKFTANDLTSADDELAGAITHAAPGCRWVFRQWNGEEVRISGYEEAATVTEEKLEVYTQRVLAMRRTALMPALNEMKRGFDQNSGLPADKKLDGRTLSELAQGASTVSIEELQVITEAQDDPAIQRQWRVLAGFSDIQRKLFLKFTTGLSGAVPPQDIGWGAR
jgi:hypothetical protein